jgi:excisionase family DNA binding protein
MRAVKRTHKKPAHPAKLPNDRDFFTVPEIARALRCRESTVTGWAKTGRLAAIDLSSSQRPRYRIARAALDAFLEGQTVAPPSRPARRQRRDSVPQYV